VHIWQTKHQNAIYIIPGLLELIYINNMFIRLYWTANIRSYACGELFVRKHAKINVLILNIILVGKGKIYSDPCGFISWDLACKFHVNESDIPRETC
jgi:hypothetical protein